MYRLFHDVQIQFRSILSSGNTVVVEEPMTATLPDGRTYENDYCFVFVLEAERIKHVRGYMDTLKGQKIIFGT